MFQPTQLVINNHTRKLSLMCFLYNTICNCHCYVITTQISRKQHNVGLLTFKHNLLTINQSETICNSLDASLNEVLREGSLNNTVVSSANKVKCNVDNTYTQSFI